MECDRTQPLVLLLDNLHSVEGSCRRSVHSLGCFAVWPKINMKKIKNKAFFTLMETLFSYFICISKCKFQAMSISSFALVSCSILNQAEATVVHL